MAAPTCSACGGKTLRGDNGVRICLNAQCVGDESERTQLELIARGQHDAGQEPGR